MFNIVCGLQPSHIDMPFSMVSTINFLHKTLNHFLMSHMPNILGITNLCPGFGRGEGTTGASDPGACDVLAMCVVQDSQPCSGEVTTAALQTTSLVRLL